MAFVHPAFLWALAALAIPVLIHLFQLRRYRRIDFPDVRFLAEVTQQTRARRKVQHWLVLLARLLAISFLVLAFAQPYLPGADGTVKAGERAVSIHIDDSFSMDGQNAGGRLLDQARKGAQDAIMAHAPTTRFQVITSRMEGRQQMLTGRDEAMEAAASVETGPYATPLSRILVRQRDALSTAEAPVKRAFLFTDLQRSTTDVENWTNDPAVPTVIVPLIAGRPDNLSIDSVWFASPVRRAGQSEELRVRIRNHGAQDLVNVPLRLHVNGRQRALATFGVNAESVVDTLLRFTIDRPGLYHGETAIDDQPVTFDDRMPLAMHVSDRTDVLLVHADDLDGDRAITAVFEGDSLHALTTATARAIDPAVVARQDLVVLNALPEVPSGLLQVLAALVEEGGSIAVFPPAHHGPEGYAELYARFGAAAPAALDTGRARVERIDLEHPFYRDVFQTMPRNVDLPFAQARWSLRPAPGSDVLLRTQDDRPYLAHTRVGKGSVYLSAVPLAADAGNLTRHALFATSLLRMAELARPMGPLYHIIGEGAIIPLERQDLPGGRPPVLHGPDGVVFTPEVRRSQGVAHLVLHDQDVPPGPYAVVVGTDTIAHLALAMSRRESDLSAWSVDELREVLAQRGLDSFTVLDSGARDLSLRLTELDQGRKLWKWCILFALLALAAEVFLIRLLR
ncbi:MAG: BatA domain-containing protein [Flavobacteriales bacterium]|jgi:hypothetical protein|nr:BatA domain-containing protein [Flavobacteriales bacterium]